MNSTLPGSLHHKFPASQNPPVDLNLDGMLARIILSRRDRLETVPLGDLQPFTGSDGFLREFKHFRRPLAFGPYQVHDVIDHQVLGYLAGGLNLKRSGRQRVDQPN